MVVAWKGTDTKEKEKKKDVLCWKVRGISDPGGKCGKTIACGQRQLFGPVASLRKSQSRFFQSDEIFEDLFHPEFDTCYKSTVCANASVVL